jgi:hypothetical protein
MKAKFSRKKTNPFPAADVLGFLEAAGPLGMEIDALVVRCARLGLTVTRDALLAGVRDLARRGLVSLDDKDRVFITTEGVQHL